MAVARRSNSAETFGCLLGFALLAVAQPLGAADAESPIEEVSPTTIELDEGVEPGDGADGSPTLEVDAIPPFRASYGRSQLYLPPFFHGVNGKYDLLVHFHGMGSIQEGNVVRAQLNAAVVSVNVGVGSGPYEEAFRDPSVFQRLVSYSAHVIEKSGRAPGARLGRVAVSAWSAGYGAVASLLRQPQNTRRIDAVLLEDGLHSDWTDEKRRIVADAPLQKYAHIAAAAMHGEKLFAITHSAIPTDGYPSSTETVGELLRLMDLERTPDELTGPRGMHQLYTSDSGDLHVKGYDGIGVKDHIDHIRAMSETVLPYLKARWEPPHGEP
jgi:hypothetical protein